jgi:hypothetical protein
MQPIWSLIINRTVRNADIGISHSLFNQDTTTFTITVKRNVKGAQMQGLHKHSKFAFMIGVVYSKPNTCKNNYRLLSFQRLFV